MYPEHYFLLFSIALAAGCAAYAWSHGVVTMLWGSAGVFAGLAAGSLAYRFILVFVPIGFGAQLAIAFVAGLVVWVIVRALVKKVLMRLFQIDGPLHFLCEGFAAAALSLLPSLLTILVLATGIRIGGTLADLRRYELLATPNADFLAKDYPARPLAAEWRDGVEALPVMRDCLDWIEPLGREPERTLAALLIASKKPPLHRHLLENPETKPIFESPAFQGVRQNEEVKALNEQGERLNLLRHPALRSAALDPGLEPKLAGLEFHRLVDAYLLSPGYQALLESYRRDPEDRADPDK